MVFLNLIRLQNKIIKIVKQASKIFEKGTGNITEKNGAANLVTDADINIQKFLQTKLQKLISGSGFLCEEETTADSAKDYTWVIDPIDGTANFTRDIPECAISVGLLYKGEPLIGVVYAPRLKLLFNAVKGCGAYCSGKRISTSKKTFEQSLFCTGLCLYQKELSDSCSAIIAEAHPLCSDIRRFGSCALEICYLAMGRCDLFFEIRTYPWDYAAASLILEESGGILRSFKKEKPDFKNMTMLIGANNTENFEKLNTIIENNIRENPIFKE